MEQYLTKLFWQSQELLVLRNERRTSQLDGLEEFANQESRLLGHLLFATSGSSGEAKWVALSKEALLSSARKVCEYFQIHSEDRLGLVLPLYHVGGFGLLARAYVSGATCRLWENDWSAVEVIHWLENQQVTITSMVPAQVLDLCNAGVQPPSCLRALVVGGGYLEEDVLERMKERNWPVYVSYGQTEASSQIATGKDDWMDILDGIEVRSSEDGCLEWRGSNSFSGYVRKKNQEWSFDPVSAGSWVKTQDVVELSGRKLRFLSRKDRVVKVLGELVDVDQLERELREESGVAIKIVTLADKRRGVRLVPVVEQSQLDSGVFANLRVRSGVERLEPFCRIKKFPRTELGKVSLMELEGMVKEVLG